VDLSNYTETSKAFDEATNLHRGQHVEILISCVGGAPLGLFNDLQPEIFQQAMNTNYYSTLWSVKVSLSRSRDGEAVKPKSIVTRRQVDG